MSRDAPKQRSHNTRAQMLALCSEYNAIKASTHPVTRLFARRAHTFSLPLRPQGTPFQCAVWHALAHISFGQTWSYAQLAAHIGRPSASRAVGAANARNPLPIVLPCHRVIGSNGALTGFNGGLHIKRSLLYLEGIKPTHTCKAIMTS